MQLEIFDNRRGAVSDVPLHEATRSRYLNYALSVITSRALPDVRDGLKPVQRRILYAMLHNLHLRPDGRYRKSAAVVGEVMAKYHPHGDSAIYDAMVRMAQDFSLRYPLVDGQGNFGSIDGDSAAAMRYTECKLQQLAIELLNELKRDTVPMRVNYDGTLEEPVVLPAQVPNLLINGVTGIAVGMATNIPPHNLSEVIDACAYLVDHQKEEEPDLSPFVKGPDFPTGGQILNTPEELQEIYAKGEGPVSIQGEWSTEVIDRKRYILLTSIPFNVIKADLVTQIADHISKGKIPQLVDIRDESTDDIRVVIEMKRGADAEVAMAYLFKHTSLQTKFHVNMTVLCPTDNPEVGSPSRLGLVPVLRHFLDFRFEVVTKRLEHQLRELLERIHILEGFEKVFDHLDEAIAIIRASDDRKDAGTRLKARFELTDIQADAILDTRLHKLARMEILSIREELAEKRTQAARLQALLSSPRRLWNLVKSELIAIKDSYGDPRRTKISGPTKVVEFDPDAYIVNEPCTVIVTRGGWIKRQKSFKSVASIRVREGDEVGWVFETTTRRSATFFTDQGSAYTLRADDIPATTGYGEPIQAHFQFGDGERLIAVIPQDDDLLPQAVPPPGSDDPGEDTSTDESSDGEGDKSEAEESEGLEPMLLAVTRGGKCLRLPLSTFAEPSTRTGRKYARLQKKFAGDSIVGVFPSGGDELVTIATKEARALVFPAHQVKLLRGAGMGVTAIKLGKGDWVLDYVLARDRSEGVKVTTNRGREVIVGPRKYNIASRGGKGQAIITRGSIELDKPEPLMMMKEDTSEEEEE